MEKKRGKREETDRYRAVDMGFRRPAIPYQSGRIQERCDPCVFPHTVLGLIHQLAVAVVPSGLSRFAGHDGVGPPSAEDAGYEITYGAWNIGEADYDGGEIVWRFGEGPFDTDVDQIQRAKRDADIVDRDEHGREAKIEENL